MQILCELVGGSHLYGLSTIESDIDKRGVFINTEPGKILGLSRKEIIKESSEDSVYFELCHFLSGLKKTNTQMVEFLFAPLESFTQLSDEFREIKENKFSLIDSDLFYKSLLGYIYNEKRLANGERVGNLGSKRKDMVEKFGFSPKNFSHLFRLSFCGITFFKKGYYPVSLISEDKAFRDFVFSVKTEPEKYKKEYLNVLVDQSRAKLEVAYKNRKVNYEFNSDLANEFCRKFYLPYLVNKA
jgi:predicted nucleotidyltransferase